MSVRRVIAAFLTSAAVAAAVAACGVDDPAPVEATPHQEVLVPAEVSSLDADAIDQRLAILINGDLPDDPDALEPSFASPDQLDSCPEQPTLTLGELQAALGGLPAPESVGDGGCDPDRSVTINPSAGGAGQVRIKSTPANGFVEINVDGTVTYVPRASFSGVDSFAYEFTDSDGATTSTTVSISMTAPAAE